LTPWMAQMPTSGSVYTAPLIDRKRVPLQQWTRHTHLEPERWSYGCQEHESNGNPVVGLQQVVHSERSDWDY
jgi:hypothetical protein